MNKGSDKGAKLAKWKGRKVTRLDGGCPSMYKERGKGQIEKTQPR